MQNLRNPQTIDEYLYVTGTDDDLYATYKRWIENIMKRTYRDLFWSFVLGVVFVEALVLAYMKGWIKI